jgi:sodium transport system permease protein
LVILIPMIPSMLLMSNPIKAETWHMAIPMFSHNLLVAEVARGEPLSGLWWLIATMSTGVLAALFALVAIWAFSRPKMIFADTE